VWRRPQGGEIGTEERRGITIGKKIGKKGKKRIKIKIKIKIKNMNKIPRGRGPKSGIPPLARRLFLFLILILIFFLISLPIPLPIPPLPTHPVAPKLTPQ
jgi:hypothetical protein